MYEHKLLEVRDRATFMPVLAIRLDMNAHMGQRDRALLNRVGFATDKFVMLIDLEGRRIDYNPYNWPLATLPVVHRELEQNWTSYESGDVIDAEHLRGERDAPRESELAPYF